MVFSCKTDAASQYLYSAPRQFKDGLEVGNIQEVDLDSLLIYKSLSKIKSGKYDEVHSLLIYKEDKLILEEYFKGHDYNWDLPNFWGEIVQWDENRLHNIMSGTKSVTSLLIGIAIEQGFIQSEKESIFTYLPAYTHYRKGGMKDITIEHLLTMTSGIEGNEWTSSYRNLENPIIRLWLCEDPIQCILENPMAAKPGTHFSYWGGNQILLGEILKNATGMDIHRFADEYLFNPLGIEDTVWSQINNGPHDTAGGLKLNPRAMIKIGIAFLNYGRWQDRQIIPENWVEKSATSYRNNLEIMVPGVKSWRHGYTFGWWTKSWDEPSVSTYFANGWGGQNIMVIPEAEMVVVFTGGNYTKVPPPKKIMDKYIIPALILE